MSERQKLIVMRSNENGEIEFALSSDEVMIRALEAYREKILAEDNEYTLGRVEIMMIPMMIDEIREDNPNV